MKQGKRDDGYRMSDALWEQIEPLLPAPKLHPLGCHRPRVSNRAAMDAILLVLRTGMQWNALDGTGICSCSSAYRRFREGLMRACLRLSGAWDCWSTTNSRALTGVGWHWMGR
jgi:transposase